METQIILKKVKVVDPGGSFDGKKVDVKIIDGIITEIGRNVNCDSCLILNKENSIKQEIYIM